MRKIIVDNFKRHLYYYGESYRFVQKLCYTNLYLMKTLRMTLRNAPLLKRITSIKLVNRCMHTGRKTGVATYMKLSRLEFLRLAREGVLLGMKKRTR